MLRDYVEKMFQARIRLGYDIFNFLVNIVAPLLQKQDTHIQDCIPVEKHVALSLAHRGSRNSYSITQNNSVQLLLTY